MKKANPDSELADAAKAKAGGISGLAKIFGVTPGAASRWGRTSPIPRHLRPRIEAFVQGYNPSHAPTIPAGEGLETWGNIRMGLQDDPRLRKAVGELVEVLRGPDQKAAEWLLGNIQIFAERARAQLEPRRRRRAG